MELTTSIKPLRLSQLTGSIERMFQAHFNEKSYWVIADVTGHSYYSDRGQHWFSLVEKDETGHTVLAELKAVAWRPATERITQFEHLTGPKERYIK